MISAIKANMKDEAIRAPLTFAAGDARVVIYKNSNSYMIQPCLI